MADIRRRKGEVGDNLDDKSDQQNSGADSSDHVRIFLKEFFFMLVFYVHSLITNMPKKFFSFSFGCVLFQLHYHNLPVAQ